MTDYDLSVLIPAKNEDWLAETVKDILKNKRGKTEIIVGMDGNWAEPGLEDHPDVRIVHVSKSRGQRGMTNTLARLSKAKWVAKCDAHCAFDEGFDVKLMEAAGDHNDWTLVPVMRNMHVFNWRCMDCGDETYQGPAPEGCKNCNVNTPDRFEKKLVWNPKPSPNSSAFKFTPNRLQFKYFGSLKNKQQKSGEKVGETMSLQGSFFMLTRAKYWELNICDESWGGWGQQGTEVALKTWLSGGRVVCVMNTWYAHMFRTQDGFAFPWGNPASQQNKARKISFDLFTKNEWPLQTRPLSWVIERFWDELQQEPNKDDDPQWTKSELDKLKAYDYKVEGDVVAQKQPSKGILYFTDNELPLKIARTVQARTRNIAQKHGYELVSSSRKPMDNMGKNVVTPEPRGVATMYKQILAGLEAMDADIIFMAEHDVLYPKEHFDFTPPYTNTFYYDHNWYKIHPDGLIVTWDADQVSGLCAYRGVLLDHYRLRLEQVEKGNISRSYEPGDNTESWKSAEPYVDLRTGHNLTYNKRSLEDFRRKDTAKNFRVVDEIPHWATKPLLDLIN